MSTCFGKPDQCTNPKLCLSPVKGTVVLKLVGVPLSLLKTCRFFVQLVETRLILVLAARSTPREQDRAVGAATREASPQLHLMFVPTSTRRYT